MGFATPVFGHIKVECDLKGALDQIQQLPSINEDEWPFRFYYKWELDWREEIPVRERKLDNKEWIFKGEPRSF